MMRHMGRARTPLGTIGAVIAAVLVLLAVLSPTLLRGRSLSTIDLIVTGAGVLGIGALARWTLGPRGRTFATLLVAIGALILALALGLLALLLAGFGRGV